jgi:hypothetical protein
MLDASVVIAGVALFAFVWWLLGGRKYYVGPRANTHVLEAQSLDSPPPMDDFKV